MQVLHRDGVVVVQRADRRTAQVGHPVHGTVQLADQQPAERVVEMFADSNLDGRGRRRRGQSQRVAGTGGHLTPQRNQGAGVTPLGVPHLDGCCHSDLLVWSTPEVNGTADTLVLAQQ